MTMTHPLAIAIKDLSTTLIATLVAPLVVLLFDYFYRSSNNPGSTWADNLGHCGPDCCILSLGATGAIMIDPHTKAALGEFLGLFFLFFFFTLMFIRVACTKAQSSDAGEKARTLRYGVWSLLLVSSVVVFSYVIPAIK